MYKIIFSDLDETLLNDDHEICQRNIDLIMKARDLGVKFVPATGRGYASITNVLEPLGLIHQENEYVMSFNGGALTENKGNRLLDFQGLDYDKVNEIFQFGLKQDVCIHVYTLDKLYVFKLSESESERLIHQKVECEILEENSIEFLKDTPISKILYQNIDTDYLKTLEPQMKSIVENCCAVSYSSNRYMEFNKIGVDKGKGLHRLAALLGVDIRDTIAIGDNYNDLAMLEAAGLSVASGNSVQAVKDACDYVCTSDNNEGCVAEVIEKFILGEHYDI